MKFEEALTQAREGKYITRNGWDLKKQYLKMDKDSLLLMKIGDKFNLEKWNPSNEDVLAEDWTTITQEEINVFKISEAKLLELGVSKEIIEKIKELNSPISSILSNPAIKEIKMKPNASDYLPTVGSAFNIHTINELNLNK